MSRYYILDKDKNIIPTSLREWKEWCERTNRVIVDTHVGENFVRTQYVGLNMRLGDDGPPLVYTTFVFGPDDEKYSSMYSSTLEDAIKSHNLLVTQLKSQLNIDV